MEFAKTISSLKKINKEEIANRNIVVWGMGNVAMLHEKAFQALDIPIYAYTSNNLSQKDIHNGYNGCQVIRPDEIQGIENTLIIICVLNNKYVIEIENQVKSMKLECLTVTEFLFGLGADIILQNVSALEDERSKDIYMSLILKRLSRELKMYEEYEPRQYFALPMFSVADSEEVFVDMGAYVGDILEQYIFTKSGYFKKYYAFEPDERNYKALVKRISRIQDEWNISEDAIIPIFAGTGQESGEMYFCEEEHAINSHTCRYAKKGSEQLTSTRKIIALDDYFKNEKVTFLKADIESNELDMLKGAVKVIKRDKPKLAISIYHNAVDMYYIQDWISKLKLGYRFFIRHHNPSMADTVLYAICDADI